MNPRTAHRFRSRNRLSDQARARINDLFSDLAQLSDERDHKLATETRPDRVAGIQLQWAGAHAAITIELAALGAITPEVADEHGDKLIKYCRQVTIDAIPIGLADTGYGQDIVDAVVEGLLGAAEHGANRIELVRDLSAYLSWMVEVYTAIGNFDARRLRLLALTAPVSGARLLARFCGEIVHPIHDRLVCRHLIYTARAALHTADQHRSADVVRQYRRRGPPCRRTASRITRCAPVGANAPPLPCPQQDVPMRPTSTGRAGTV